MKKWEEEKGPVRKYMLQFGDVFPISVLFVLFSIDLLGQTEVQDLLNKKQQIELRIM